MHKPMVNPIGKHINSAEANKFDWFYIVPIVNDEGIIVDYVDQDLAPEDATRCNWSSDKDGEGRPEIDEYGFCILLV